VNALHVTCPPAFLFLSVLLPLPSPPLPVPAFPAAYALLVLRHVRRPGCCRAMYMYMHVHMLLPVMLLVHLQLHTAL
jgi:hypothetical protein